MELGKQSRTQMDLGMQKMEKTRFFLIFNSTENANARKTPRTPEESTGFLEFIRNRQSRICEKNSGIRVIFLAFTV